MNFHQLEYIIAVHVHKNFSKAAASCNVTQATLSSMIKKLEQEVKMVLFDRSKQPVVTTEEGLKFIQISKQILGLRSNLYELSDSVNNSIQGSIKLGVIPTIANSLLPLILPKILEHFPQLELEISEVTTENIKEQLKQGKLDAGILATPIEDESLIEHILYYESMMLYGVKERSKKFLAATDFEKERIWLLEEGNCFRNQSITLCNIQERSKGTDHISFKGSSFDTLINMADQFGGFTLIPELYYQLMSQEKQDKSRPFELPMPVREVSLVYHRPYAKRKTIDSLAALIIDEISPLLATHSVKAKNLSIIGIN